MKSLAEDLELPLAQAAELLADDREDYVTPAGLAPPGDAPAAAAPEAEGTLLTRGTVDAYIAAVIELWRVQVAQGSHNTNPRVGLLAAFFVLGGTLARRKENILLVRGALWEW